MVDFVARPSTDATAYQNSALATVTPEHILTDIPPFRSRIRVAISDDLGSTVGATFSEHGIKLWTTNGDRVGMISHAPPYL